MPISRFSRPTLALALAGLALAFGATGAQAAPCAPEHNGRLVSVEINDPENQGSKLLYASHRLQLRFELGDGSEDAEGASYDPDAESVRLAPAPGVVNAAAYIGRPGKQSVTVEWTVKRSAPFVAPAPFCTGSQVIELQLRKPKPTRFQVRPDTVDRTGAEPRLAINVAGERDEDLSPFAVSIRNAGGKRRNLFTVPLADVSGGHEDGLRRYRFSKQVAGMTISSAPTNALTETRGLTSISLHMPKLKDGQRLRRSFALDLSREGRVLLRVRATIACRGSGRPYTAQLCSMPLYRVSHPG